MSPEFISFINFIKLGYKNKYLYITYRFYSPMIINILRILYNNNFIAHYEFLSNNKVKIKLKYENGNPIINNLKIISTSSKKIYYKYRQLFFKKDITYFKSTIKLKKKKLKTNIKLKNEYKIKKILKNKDFYSILKKIKNNLKKKKKIIYNISTNLPKKKRYKKYVNYIIKNTSSHDTLKSFSHFNLLSGFLMLSTSKGIINHINAYNLHIGGELMCKIN